MSKIEVRVILIEDNGTEQLLNANDITSHLDKMVVDILSKAVPLLSSIEEIVKLKDNPLLPPKKDEESD